MDAVDWSVPRPQTCNVAVCARCASDPESHSIYERGYFNDAPVLYTKPAEAKLFGDTLGIRTHFRNVVSGIHPAPWIWVLDAEGLTLRHALDPRPALALVRLISSEFSESVQAVYIIRANAAIRTLLGAVSPLLTSELRAKLTVTYA
jgi:hypothetical protein